MHVSGIGCTTTINNVMSRLDTNSKCTLLTSARPKDGVGQVFGDNPSMLTTWNDLGIMEKASGILRTQANCVISVMHLNSTQSGQNGLEILLSAVVSIDNHVTIYLARERPSKDLLKSINRPFIWINTSEKDNKKHALLFCPKVGKPQMPESKTLMFSQERHILGTQNPEQLWMACSHPLRGQVVTFAAIPVRPQFHPPNTVGNLRLSGYTVNLFFLYAKYFAFKPKIYPTGGGSFIPHNKTFSPGSLNDVSYI